MPDLFQDTFAPIFPFEHPTWTVAVHLSGRVLVAQHVIAHHRKDAYFFFVQMKIQSFPIWLKKRNNLTVEQIQKVAYKSAGFGRDGPAGSTVSLAVGAPWLKKRRNIKIKSNRKKTIDNRWKEEEEEFTAIDDAQMSDDQKVLHFAFKYGHCLSKYRHLDG
jgi:hypothetical protein